MRKKIHTLITAGVAIVALSGCDTLCGIAFCTDQTSTQRTYVDARDECRELSELKAGVMNSEGEVMETESLSKTKKSELVKLFSDCMGTKGWTVPGPSEKKDVAATDPNATGIKSPLMAPAAAPAPPPPAQDARVKRSAECAFARQAAASSAISAARADACDIECLEGRRLAPEAPKPAACP